MQRRVNDSSCCLSAEGNLGRGNEMGRLREPVHYGQNHRVALRGARAVTKSSEMWYQGLERLTAAEGSPQWVD